MLIRYEDLVNELARVNEELAGMCEQERLVKQANRIRGKILLPDIRQKGSVDYF